MKKIKQLFFTIYSRIDQRLKFPQLKRGEIGIQLGFDMYSPITSDLFSMTRRVGKTGLTIGIDPDSWNHEVAQQIIKDRKLNNIKLVEAGTYNQKKKCKLIFGKRASWNQLDNLPLDTSVEFTGEEKEVQLNTLDNIIADLNIDVKKIGHVNFTNNGAEYYTLQGFENSLKEADDIALTVISGRYDETGTINGRPDYELVLDYLHDLGFTTKFKRIDELFWWGFCVKLLINRTWVFSKKNYGVIFAVKGKKKIPFYQSFS